MLRCLSLRFWRRYPNSTNVRFT